MDENFLLLFFLSFFLSLVSCFLIHGVVATRSSPFRLVSSLIIQPLVSLRSSSWSDDRMSHQLLSAGHCVLLYLEREDFTPSISIRPPFILWLSDFPAKWSILSRAPQIISNMKSQRRRCHITGKCIERERWSGCVVNVSLLCGCWGCYCVLSNNRGRGTANKPALITLAELVLVRFFYFFLPSTSLNIRGYISRRICTLTAYVRACFTPLSKHQNVGWIFSFTIFLLWK